MPVERHVRSVITSLLISEPHNCDICNKSFKRPQDLKKHEKIHTEEHHAAHKHSKAITIGLTSESPQSTRLVAPKQPSDGGLLNLDKSIRPGPERSPSVPAQNWSPPATNTDTRRSHSYSTSDETNGLSQPTWEHIDPPPPTKIQKRGLDATDGANAAVDGFFRDMKKRKYAPAYDAQMANRLSALSSVAFADHRMALSENGQRSLDHHYLQHEQRQRQQQQQQQQQLLADRESALLGTRTMNMNPNLSLAALQANTGHPASVAALALSSLPLQALPGSPEELAIVNNFLVRLGEEIAAGNIGAQSGPAKNAPPSLNFGDMGGANSDQGNSTEYNFESSQPSQQNGRAQQQQTVSNSQSHSHTYPGNLIPGRHSLQNGYFDAATLAALGLVNVPGLGNQLDYKDLTSEPHRNQPSIVGRGDTGSGLYGSASAIAGLQATSQHHHQQQLQRMQQQQQRQQRQQAHRHTPSGEYRHSPKDSNIPSATSNSRQSTASSSASTTSSVGTLYPFGHLFSPSSESASDVYESLGGGLIPSPLMFAAGPSNASISAARSPQPSTGLDQQQHGLPQQKPLYGSVSPLPSPLPNASFDTSSNGTGNGNGDRGGAQRPNSINGTFLGAITSKAHNYGLPVVPQLEPMDSQPGPKVTKHVLPLQSAQRANSAVDDDDEKAVKVEVEDDDTIDGDELGSEMDVEVDGEDATPKTTGFAPSDSRGGSPPMDPTIEPHFPTRDLPLPRPSTAPRLYPSITTPPPSTSNESRSSITLPSAASLISEADQIEAERAQAMQSSRHRVRTMESTMYPSLASMSMTTGSSHTRSSSRASVSSISSRTSRPHSSSASLTSTVTGHDDVVLPPLAALALNNRLEAGRSRLSSQSYPSPTPPSSSRSLLERLQHVELIKAMLVWINTEYVKLHGDPWVQEARKKGPVREVSQPKEQQQTPPPPPPPQSRSPQPQSNSYPLTLAKTTYFSDDEDDYDELESEDGDEDAPDAHEERDRWSNQGDFEEEDSGDEGQDESDDAMLVSPATTSHATLVAPAPDVEMVAA
ncbi:hypothetical protein FRB96_000416 [Tulasnella sp. 330]|nr:hypothetical protein FRB96_000416 [Tulasnella sp. 330]